MPILSANRLWRLGLKERAIASIRKRGLIGTLRLLPGFIIASVAGDPERRFDRRFNVDTAGIIKPRELLPDIRFKDSNGYGPTSTRRFTEMLRNIHVDFRKFVFIDVGCGKGKAVLLASRLPFKLIIGVEVWSELLSAAEKNLRTYSGKRKCNAFRLCCADARDFVIPDEPSIYYFFDPFLRDVMRTFLENIRLSLEVTPREVYIIYCEPESCEILDESGFLTLVHETTHFAIYKAA